VAAVPCHDRRREGKDALRLPSVVGVVGAGTMGAGIAQVACVAGFETRLHDPIPEALERGIERIRSALDRSVERGRLTRDDADAAVARLQAAATMEELATCELVIEAAPEKLELKRELFGRLSEICGPETVLATNTSSLPVTGLASGAAKPENVVGMHFFNPVPAMDLLEVVAGDQSAEAAIALARHTGERFGKRVIVARDGPGFLANRCARPFGMEALKLFTERVAGHSEIDRIVRMGGGFPMGPFELADLVGIDVGFEVSKSFWEQSFHEPRWRPSIVQARMVQAGRFGRKAGRGYYDYSGDGPHRPDDLEPPAAGGSGRVAIEGDGRLADDLREAAEDAGYDVRFVDEFEEGETEILVDASVGRSPIDPVPEPEDPNVLVCILCVDGSLAELDLRGTAVGFHALPPFEESGLVELTWSRGASESNAMRADAFFRSLGKHVERVGDAPGLVLGRIVCQLVNEAAFAVSEGVGSPRDVDVAMRHGYNWPRGPLEWADTIELDQVLATLDSLHEELREERYRAAPLLRHMVADGRVGRSTGEGFFNYDD
jgi:3-hydroxybutyryl-CoA dehydrogenase